MNKSLIISTLRSNKAILNQRFNISKLGLFGSYSTSTNSKESDIDIIYELKEGKRLGFMEVYELETFFKSLFEIDKIDLINSKYMNPIIENEMSKTVIYV